MELTNVTHNSILDSNNVYVLNQNKQFCIICQAWYFDLYEGSYGTANVDA